MKTIILFLLFSGVTWACSQPGKSTIIPATRPDPLEKIEPDPLRRQFKRFGFDVTTGKYLDYPGYQQNDQKEGC